MPTSFLYLENVARQFIIERGRHNNVLEVESISQIDRCHGVANSFDVVILFCFVFGHTVNERAHIRERGITDKVGWVYFYIRFHDRLPREEGLCHQIPYTNIHGRWDRRQYSASRRKPMNVIF